MVKAGSIWGRQRSTCFTILCVFGSALAALSGVICCIPFKPSAWLTRSQYSFAPNRSSTSDLSFPEKLVAIRMRDDSRIWLCRRRSILDLSPFPKSQNTTMFSRFPANSDAKDATLSSPPMGQIVQRVISRYSRCLD